MSLNVYTRRSGMKLLQAVVICNGGATGVLIPSGLSIAYRGDFRKLSMADEVNMATQTFDVEKIVNHFGGRSCLHAKLVGAGMKITVRAIDQWLYRNRIPSDVLATLLRLSILDGEPLDLMRFTRRTGDNPRPDTPDLRAIDSLLD